MGAASLVAGATLQHEAIAARLDDGYLDATTLMEHCIKQGIPQRTAHHLVGTLVRSAMERGCTLSELSDDAKNAFEFVAGEALFRNMAHRA